MEKKIKPLFKRNLISSSSAPRQEPCNTETDTEKNTCSWHHSFQRRIRKTCPIIVTSKLYRRPRNVRSKFRNNCLIKLKVTIFLKGLHVSPQNGINQSVIIYKNMLTSTQLSHIPLDVLRVQKSSAFHAPHQLLNQSQTDLTNYINKDRRPQSIITNK